MRRRERRYVESRKTEGKVEWGSGEMAEEGHRHLVLQPAEGEDVTEGRKQTRNSWIEL